MQKARYSPIVSQAEITGKGQPDLHSLRQRANTEGHDAYPGGTLNENLTIMPGELLVARRNCRNTAGHYGRASQACFSAVGGLVTDEKTLEGMMRDLVFVGVAKSEYQYGGDNLFGQDPLDHGFGFLYSGSFTIINTSGEDIYAFDRLCWRLPPTSKGDPRTQGSHSSHSIDTGLNPMTVRRIGTPQGKQTIMVQRYDPCDFTFQVAGAFDLFSKSKTQGGVQGFTLADFFLRQKDATRNMASTQEEAFAYSRGLLTILAAGDANPAAKAEEYGLFTSQITAAGLGALGRLFGRNVFPGTNGGNEANREGKIDGTNAQKWTFVLDHWHDLLLGGLAGSMDSKKDRLIGIAIGSAKPDFSLDMAVRIGCK